MEESVHQRFIKAWEWTELTSNGLATKLGTNPKTTWNYTSAGRTPSYAFLRKMVDVYPQLSFEWLLTGEGNMLVGTMPKEDATAHDKDEAEKHVPVSFFDKMEKLYQETISVLKSQLEDSKKKCDSLEEINKHLMEMLKEMK